MKDDELKNIFLAEAEGNYEDLNRLFTELEKNHQDQKAIASIFRITHTLKANAAAMGFEGIADLSHVLEDIFSLIKDGSMQLSTDTFETLFRANDKLGDLIGSVKSGKKVSYRGLHTKLKVILREAKETTEQTENSLQESTSPSESGDAQSEEKENETKQEEAVNEGAKNEKSTEIAFSDFVQVPVEKLDQLMNLVGELSIERDRLITKQLVLTGGRSSNEYASLYRISSDLQYAVMSVRLVKVSVLFNKFFRIVRDVATLEGKKVDLVLEGTEIEIDRNVLQAISDSMIHLVRNAVSHGLEEPAEREAKGKSAVGKITLRAKNDRDAIAIEVEDDGKGIDEAIIKRKAIEKGIVTPEQAGQMLESEIIQLIFEAGFSSREQVSEVSGRGVGMDVVRKAMEKIGGDINTRTQLNKGTVFTLYLPASMAVKKALLFFLREESFAIPLSFIESVVQMGKEDLYKVGKGLVGTHAGEAVSIIFLRDLFRSKESEEKKEIDFHYSFNRLEANSRFHVVLISIEEKLLGFVVDKLQQQKEIIERPLAGIIKNSKYISGATILGDGTVCLVLDVPTIIRQVFRTANAVLQ